MAAAARRFVYPAPAAPAPPMNTADTNEWVRANAGAAWATLTVIFGASLLLPPPGHDGAVGHLPSICPFYNLTGLPCPGCGLTRAFVCLGHGQWRESLHWHPLGWLIYGVCLLLWLRSGLFWGLGMTLGHLPPRAAARLGWCAAAVILLTGIARIGWLTAHHLRF